MEFLSVDNPSLYEKVKDHILEVEERDGEEYYTKCKECGKDACQRADLRWVCPELYHIESKYFR